jgi:hypothetical protein
MKKIQCYKSIHNKLTKAEKFTTGKYYDIHLENESILKVIDNHGNKINIYKKNDGPYFVKHHFIYN